MRTQALTGRLSYPNIRDGLHAYLVGEELPPEIEPHVMAELTDYLWGEAAHHGIAWQVDSSLAEAEDGYPIVAELTEIVESVDYHRLVGRYMPHPHYPPARPATDDWTHKMRHIA